MRLPLGDVQHVVFRVAGALEIPVLVLILAALAFVLVEVGRFAVELVRRRDRDFGRLEEAAEAARGHLVQGGDLVGASARLQVVAWSDEMGEALDFMVRQCGMPDAVERLAKALADFDFVSMRKLERTRVLVRVGPALGLMGTLIPLSPALAGLANGDVEQLSSNLRVAFSVTVLGLLVGALAYLISLVRERLYGQDLSDLEFVASRLAGGAR
ncbi:MAG: MotA/TolQ/ExbB proton channel family protein [Solirubrobacterales bacterium]